MDDTSRPDQIVVYGDDYCPQARALARALARHRIAHEWRDVRDGDPRFQDELRQLARGYLSVPTVVFPDGSVLVEPEPDQVLGELRRRRPGVIGRLFGRWLGRR